MLTTNIRFKNFKFKKDNKRIKKDFKLLLSEKNNVIESLTNYYKYNFKKKNLHKYKKYLNVRIIGMGGSSLGAHAIYDFLSHKIKKKFSFKDNLQSYSNKKNNSKFLNLIISKSGNTIETIVNSNIYIKKKQKNIFITENKNSYLYSLAQKLKSEIIHHNNYIGGRYSVLY